jgi:hypothetical protein
MDRLRSWSLWAMGSVASVPIASTPTVVALIGGFLRLRRRNPRVFRISLIPPWVIAVLSVLVAPAVF